MIVLDILEFNLESKGGAEGVECAGSPLKSLFRMSAPFVIVLFGVTKAGLKPVEELKGLVGAG